MSGRYTVKAYVPEVQYFTEMLPIVIPNVLISKSSYDNRDRRASEIAIQAVKDWLHKNDMDCFVVKYGEKSLTKFDLYVEINWIDSAFRSRLCSAKSNLDSEKDAASVEKKDIGNIKIQCSVCYEKAPGAALVPCGHLFCWDCCTNVNLNRCPVCKTPPLFAQRLFLP